MLPTCQLICKFISKPGYFCFLNCYHEYNPLNLLRSGNQRCLELQFLAASEDNQVYHIPRACI